MAGPPPAGVPGVCPVIAVMMGNSLSLALIWAAWPTRVPAGRPLTYGWLTSGRVASGTPRRLPHHQGRAGVEFRVLGPVEVTASGRSLGLGGARARAVLAMLLAHANQVVSADRLGDELWPGHPADKAAASLQVRLSELRKAFRSAGEPDRLATRAPGYLLTVASAELDSLRFGELAAEGNAALAAEGAAAAAERLDEALALWRGPAFAGADAPSVGSEAG